MKLCTFCKQESSDNAIECPYCGHALVCKESAEEGSGTVTTTERVPGLKLKTSTLFYIGFFLMFFGLVFLAIFQPLGILILLVGEGYFLAGCWNYTNNKGWNGWLGVILGLTKIGLLVMVRLEDKSEPSDRSGLPKV